MTVIDPTSFSDPVLRERYTLGHHPRRGAATAVADSPTGWYQVNGKDFYRVSDQLLYRIDLIDGLHQVYKADMRYGHEYIGPFGPQLREHISAVVVIEADAKTVTRGKHQ